tara:strand:+ start:2176 stop:2322 length:147 start_codon:yes stop_codon:yes gene_type:complete
MNRWCSFVKIDENKNYDCINYGRNDPICNIEDFIRKASLVKYRGNGCK